ncbi:hypothetical protein [Nocardia sp. NPDC058497]|uniref:hypothetical protein n=1 Tax=Nocardia sp. NPDC058497 TaxID=3346529 RepID=UPI00365D3F6E
MPGRHQQRTGIPPRVTAIPIKRHRTARLYTEGNTAGVNVWGQLAGRRWLASLDPWTSTDIVVKIEDGNTESSIIGAVTPRSSRPF